MSYREQANMIFIYFRVNANGREAVQLYQMAFRNRSQASHRNVTAVDRHLAGTGFVATWIERQRDPHGRLITKNRYYMLRIQLNNTKMKCLRTYICL